MDDAHAPAPSESAAAEDEWAYLRTDFLGERVQQRGSPDDYVALARALLRLHSMGSPRALDLAVSFLDQAGERHPRSVAVWEHIALVSSITARDDRMAEALSVISQLDPSSRALTITEERAEGNGEEWAAHASEIQAGLLDDARSDDPALVERAVVELERLARFAPMNSTYAVNLALGLLNARQVERAVDVARAAWQIEDGSFADAYNVALVLILGGDSSEGRAIGSIAAGRAGCDEESALVTQLLALVES